MSDDNMVDQAVRPEKRKKARRMEGDEKKRSVGRPRKPEVMLKIPVSYKLPRWMVEKMRRVKKPQSIQIEDALMEWYGWERPIIADDAESCGCV